MYWLKFQLKCWWNGMASFLPCAKWLRLSALRIKSWNWPLVFINIGFSYLEELVNLIVTLPSESTQTKDQCEKVKRLLRCWPHFLAQKNLIHSHTPFLKIPLQKLISKEIYLCKLPTLKLHVKIVLDFFDQWRLLMLKRHPLNLNRKTIAIARTVVNIRRNAIFTHMTYQCIHYIMKIKSYECKTFFHRGFVLIILFHRGLL